MYDFCVIGHVTRDRIEVTGSPAHEQPGGTVYYSGLTAARLNLQTAAVTRMRSRDQELLLAAMWSAGIDVHAFDSPRTTEFVNRFSKGDMDNRTQKVLSIAVPIQPDDLDVDSRICVFGPLTHTELTSETIDRAAARGSVVALDVQGLLRQVRGSHVEHVASAEALRMLRRVEILKASRDEAVLLAGTETIGEAARVLAAAGPREVLITSGSGGSHVFVAGRLIPICAYAPSKVVDTTGCGDTYLAAYLAHRLDGGKPEEAGHFASRVAGAKTAHYGAFRGTIGTVRAVTGIESPDSTPSHRMASHLDPRPTT